MELAVWKRWTVLSGVPVLAGFGRKCLFCNLTRITKERMPARTNNKKANRGSKGTTRKNGTRSLPLVVRPPASKRALLTYATAYLVPESVAGLGGSYFFRLNSVYDPDSSGVGTSATGYSTWSALFLNYKVHRVTARIDAIVSGGTAATSSANIVVAPVASQAVVPSNAYLWKTMPYASNQTIVPVSLGGQNRAQFVKSFDLAAVARVTKEQYAVDMDFSGAVGSNPSRQIYLLLGVQGQGVTSVVTATFTVSLTYEVEWFNPVPMQ